jgi:hypothetical protein
MTPGYDLDIGSDPHAARAPPLNDPATLSGPTDPNLSGLWAVTPKSLLFVIDFDFFAAPLAWIQFHGHFSARFDLTSADLSNNTDGYIRTVPVNYTGARPTTKTRSPASTP